MTSQELDREYGWKFSRLLKDAQRAYEHSCAYCERKFAEMGYALADLTLDIVNPDAPPFYITNVRWVCATCNRQKNRTPSAQWAARRVWWDAWKKQPKPKYPVQKKLFDDDDDE